MRAAASGHRQPQRRRHRVVDRAFRRRGVDAQRTAQQCVAIQPAQHDVGVGHRRPRAAGAIRGGARIGAGTVRPDLQRAAGIDPGDRAAAGADLGKVDHRHADRMAGAVHPALRIGRAADFVFRGDRDFAADDDAGFRGRAAHVERDQVRPVKLPPRQRRGDHAGGGAGFHHGGGQPQRLGDVEHAAGRAHHVQRRQPKFRCRALQPVEIGSQQRPDIGADRGGAGAFEFADFRQHLAGQVHGDIRQCSAQRGTDRGVHGVSLRKENSSDTATVCSSGGADRFDQCRAVRPRRAA